MFTFIQRRLARYYDQKQYEIYFNQHEPLLCIYYLDVDDGTTLDKKQSLDSEVPSESVDDNKGSEAKNEALDQSVSLESVVVYRRKESSFWKNLWIRIKENLLGLLGIPLHLVDVEESRKNLSQLKYARCVILTKNLELFYRYINNDSTSLAEEQDMLIHKITGIAKWPCRLLGYKRTKTFMGFLGTAMGRALDKDEKGCNEYIKQAIIYYKKRSKELVRIWRFVYSTIQVCMFLAILGLFHTHKDFICTYLNLPEMTSCDIYYQAVIGGVLGAYFSILLKRDGIGYELFSGRKVYFFECLIRFTVSILAGIIIIVFLRSSLAPSFIANIHSHKDAFITALIAGFCERFLPSMIASAGGIQYPKDHNIYEEDGEVVLEQDKKRATVEQA